ncbi:MAG: phosphoglycerate kinase [Bacteroidota bacterium]
MEKMTIDDIALTGKRVLVRVDFNVPLDKNRVTDDTRIVETLPTIRKIVNERGKAILMSHLGRPKGGASPEFSLQPVANRLGELLNMPVKFAPDCIGPEVESLVNSLHEGEVLLLENLRFHAEEEKNDEEFSKALARLGDVYVNDAFGSAHRAHASTEGVTHFLQPAVAGYLMQKELLYLSKALENPERPFVAILGGAKISGKIEVIQNLLGKVDTILIGGGMAFTFYNAQGLSTGTSIVEPDKVSLAADLLKQAQVKKVNLLLPIDCIVADRFAVDADRKVVRKDEIPGDWMALDIGPATAKLFREEILKAKTVVWNGPMGVFEMEPFAGGTLAIAQALAEATKQGAITIIGGGDSAAAVAKAGLKEAVTHVSTGGGASLEFLEGKVLPGVAALTDKTR